MNDHTADSLINKLRQTLLPRQRLTEISEKYIQEYYASRLSGIWEKDTAPHYHFQIDTSSDKEGILLANTIIQMLEHAKKQEKIISISEKKLLEDPDQLLKKGKNTSVIITKLKASPLKKKEQKAWKRLSEIAFLPQCPVLFLIASKSTFKTRFSDPRQYEILHYQTFLYEIHSDICLEYYSDALCQYLEDLYPGKVQEDFKAAILDYIKTVRSTAIKQDEDFLEDLKRRIQSRCIQNQVEKPDGRIDAGCIPIYQFKPLASGRFFKNAPTETEKKKTKNVLLLSLSTANFRQQQIQLSDSQDSMIDYYYQLEPVPCQLMYQFEQNPESDGQKLDGIIMVCSRKTMEEIRPGINKHFKPEEFRATAHDYFVYQISDYAEKHHNAPLSFHEITTYNQETKEALSTEEILFPLINTIRNLHSWYENLNIYVDIHGGLRADQEIINTALSLLQMEGIEIQRNHIFTVEVTSQDNHSINQIRNAGEIMNIMDFAYGIHESITYGQTRALDGLSFRNNAEKKTLENMRSIAEGIQLCDVEKFENGLSDLAGSLEMLKAEPEKGYLSLFHDLIHDNYGDILLNSSREQPNTIEKIQWCIDKGFFQQALTLLESKMPAEIIRNSLLVSVAGRLPVLPENPRAASTTPPREEDVASLFNPENTDVADTIRTTLKNRGIPKYDDGSLENIILVQTGFSRSCWENHKLAYYLRLEELPPCSEFLEHLPEQLITDRAMTPGFSNPTEKYAILFKGRGTYQCRYLVYENPAAAPKINVLIRLHLQLKKERNATHHAGESESRSSLDIIKNALECYVLLYNNILKILHS